MYLQALSGLTEEIDGFLARFPKPSSAQLVELLKLYPSDAQREDVARALIARGVDPEPVSDAMGWLTAKAKIGAGGGLIWGILAAVSMAASAYHGYRRNQSVGWAIWWGAMGTVFPIITPTIALAQGFGKRKAG
jgi:hypothetical protein